MTKGEGAGEGSPPEPFTGAWLRGLILGCGVVRGRYATPSSAELEHTAAAMNILKHRAAPALPAYLRQHPVQRASWAVRELGEILPILLEEWTERADDDASSAGELRVMGDLFGAIERVQRLRCGWTQDLSATLPPVEKWREFADFLADLFRDAMKSANPKMSPLGNSNDGPVGRFVAMAVPFITNETPEVGTVVNHLKETKRRGTKRDTKLSPMRRRFDSHN